MQSIHEMTTTRRQNMPLITCLTSNPVLLQKARELDVSVVDFVAGGFLSVRLPDEAYDEWVARQIEEVLEVELMHDEVGRSSRQGAAHVCQRVRSVQISNEDWAYMMNSFGTHPDVIACWNAAVDEEINKAA